MKTEHTALPWNYGKHSQEIWCEGGGKTVAKVGYGNNPIPRFPAEKVEADGNGVFIVEACNNYDRLKALNADMLEALKVITEKLDNLFDGYPPSTMSIPFNLVRDKARAAIAKAEEKE